MEASTFEVLPLPARCGHDQDVLKEIYRECLLFRSKVVACVRNLDSRPRLKVTESRPWAACEWSRAGGIQDASSARPLVCTKPELPDMHRASLICDHGSTFEHKMVRGVVRR